MAEFKFELGAIVKEVVSGMTGVVMGRCEYLTGCNQYPIMKKGVDKDGNAHGWIWFDENRLKLQKVKRVTLDSKAKVRGCDNAVYPRKG